MGIYSAPRDLAMVGRDRTRAGTANFTRARGFAMGLSQRTP